MKLHREGLGDAVAEALEGELKALAGRLNVAEEVIGDGHAALPARVVSGCRDLRFDAESMVDRPTVVAGRDPRVELDLLGAASVGALVAPQAGGAVGQMVADPVGLAKLRLSGELELFGRRRQQACVRSQAVQGGLSLVVGERTGLVALST